MAQVAPMSKPSEEVSCNETDNVTAVELQRNRRVLYFSDGTMEESSDSDDNDTIDKASDMQINEHDMPLVSRVKYKANKVGASLLAGIDYVGGGLASFFGITTSEYAQEMKTCQKQQHLHEVNDSTWLSAGTSATEVIHNIHRRDINKNTIS